MNYDLLQQAFRVAATAHNGQVRKYTGEPYIVHPVEVCKILFDEGIRDDAMLAAALLHDVVEDTEATLADVIQTFGVDIANLVDQLTDVSRPEHGNRAARRAIDLAHTARADCRAQTIKLADLISNTRSIVAHDPKFAEVYLGEKHASLSVLFKGHPRLWLRAHNELLIGLRQLRELNVIDMER